MKHSFPASGKLSIPTLAIATALGAGGGAALAQEPETRLEEIQVIGQFVPDEKRETASVSNVVNGEQFTRSGDSNIAESLKRVAGLSTVGGKFVYVRGLGERYSTTLLNGAILPSPEPINRVVPMDLFPTAVLESVLVQKTYSAQYPSEFGGGVLQLRTKKSIDEFFWNVSSSVGMTTDVNFEQGMTIPGGDLGWLGYDDGYRGIPEILRKATEGDNELRRASRFGSGGYSPEELQTIGQSLRNEYAPQFEDLPANYDLSTSLGNFHEIGSSGATLNYLAAIDYSNSWDRNEIERKTYNVNNQGLTLDDDLAWNGTEHSIDTSGFLTTAIDFNPNHNVRLTSVVLRKTDDRVGFVEGDIAQEAYIRRTELEWIERELFSNQLQGDHYFPQFNELVVNWRYSDVKAERDSPDHRRYRYDLESDGTFEFSTRSDGNVRRYSVLDDNAEDFGLDATMVFDGPRNSLIIAQAGMVINEKERDSEIRRYSFFDQGRRTRDPELLVLPMEEIFVPENIAPDAFELREFTRPTDNYVARNESESWYVNGEINFDDRLRLNGGVRFEEFQQSVDTFDLFQPEQGVSARQNTEDMLPAFSATFINQDHQFRLAYSETLSRPDFRELSTAAFTDPITGREIIGNPELLITSITNYDFRWEWYFGFSDYMSFGVFYKEFENPIESIILGGATGIQTFTNAKAGENQGIEWEVYKSLDFLGDIGEDFYVQSNLSFIDSSVEINPDDAGIVTNLNRPLQGQSDWLFNFQAGYEPFTGTTATLLYHYFGERITEVGIEGAPDLYEQPFGELNFVFIRELNDNWKIQAKGRNLLDERSEVTQGGLISTAYNRGRQFSFQVDYTF